MPASIEKSLNGSCLSNGNFLLISATRASAADGGDGLQQLCGEESGAPLPTLGGWRLEYPVYNYVAAAPGPYLRASPPLRPAVARTAGRHCCFTASLLGLRCLWHVAGMVG